jgi:hypothetical protein
VLKRYLSLKNNGFNTFAQKYTVLLKRVPSLWFDPPEPAGADFCQTLWAKLTVSASAFDLDYQKWHPSCVASERVR